MSRVRKSGGLVVLVGGLLAGQGAFAQDAPTSQPGTLPPAQAPVVVPRAQTLPGVIPERFSIGPTPSPTPSPTPVPTPSAVESVAPVTLPAARNPRPTPRASGTPAPQVSPTPVPTVAATPAPLATSAVPAPVATETAALPAEARAPSAPWWPYALGVVVALLAAAGGSLLLLRRRRAVDDAIEEEMIAEAVPEVRVPARPPGLSGAARSAAPKPPVSPPAPPPPASPVAVEPFEIALRPIGIEMRDEGMLLDFELLIGNTQVSAAENIRVAVAMVSASPDQDRHSAAFHGSPMVEPAGPPFPLASGAGGRMQLRLALPRAHFHVVDLGGRPITVPLVMVDLRWRSGISLRHFGMDFMVGTAGQGGKLGPIRVDRRAPSGPLGATRYEAKQVVAA